jgi:hypothetical protein
MLGATRMNSPRMYRTRPDNRRDEPRSRTDLNGYRRPHRNLRIRCFRRDPQVATMPNACAVGR